MVHIVKQFGEKEKQVKRNEQAKRNEIVCRNGFTHGTRTMSPPRVKFFGWTHQVHQRRQRPKRPGKFICSHDGFLLSGLPPLCVVVLDENYASSLSGRRQSDTMNGKVPVPCVAVIGYRCRSTVYGTGTVLSA